MDPFFTPYCGKIHISLFLFFQILTSIHGSSLSVSHLIQPLQDFEGTVCTAAQALVYLRPPVVRQDLVTGGV